MNRFDKFWYSIISFCGGIMVHSGYPDNYSDMMLGILVLAISTFFLVIRKEE
jgi:hypothetical protein